MVFARVLQKSEVSVVGSVSFETWHIKVRFEYWTIFEGYLRAEIFEKQIWTFGQSLIFNVNLRIFRKSKIKNKLKLWKFYDAFREVGALLSNGLNTLTIWSIAAWQILFSLKVIINNFWDNSKWSPCSFISHLLQHYDDFHTNIS